MLESLIITLPENVLYNKTSNGLIDFNYKHLFKISYIISFILINEAEDLFLCYRTIFIAEVLKILPNVL